MSDPFNFKVLNNSINPYRNPHKSQTLSGRVELTLPRIRRFPESQPFGRQNHNPSLADKNVVQSGSMISKRHDPCLPFPRIRSIVFRFSPLSLTPSVSSPVVRDSLYHPPFRLLPLSATFSFFLPPLGVRVTRTPEGGVNPRTNCYVCLR